MSPILVIIFREISCLGPVVNLIIIGKPASFSSFAALQLFPSQWSWGIPAVLEQKSGRIGNTRERIDKSVRMVSESEGTVYKSVRTDLHIKVFFFN